MSRVLPVAVLLTLLISFSACAKNAERKAAKMMLHELDISYDKEEFFMRVANSDAVAVNLFLDAGMNPNVNSRSIFSTPLSIAALAGNTHIVKALLNKGARANEKPMFGDSSLCIAASGGHTDIVELLLESGAVIEECGCESNILYNPSGRGQTQLVRLLLENGADPNGQGCLVNAVRDGHLDIVRLLLENGANPNTGDSSEWALRYAGPYPEIIKELLKKGADPNFKDGTALIMAAGGGNEESVRILLEAGANVNASEEDGSTALMWAAEKSTEIVRILLSHGADVNAKDNNGKTALTRARENGRFDVIGLLEKPKTVRQETLIKTISGSPTVSLKDHEEVNQRKDIPDGDPANMIIAGDSPAALSARKELARMEVSYTSDEFVDQARKGDISTVQLFLESGMNPNAKEWDDFQKKSLLISSGTIKGCIAFADLILGSGNEEVMPDSTAEEAAWFEETALLAAAGEGHAEIVGLLLKRGADPDPIYVRSYGLSIDEETALMKAVEKGNRQIVRILLDFGAYAGAMDYSGNTPLTRAVERDDVEICRLLLEGYQDETLKAGGRWHDGSEALVRAAGKGNSEIVNLLLDSGVDINSRAIYGNSWWDGKTALVAAAQSGQVEVLKTLLDRGAAIDLKDDAGGTPLLRAMQERHTEAVNYLLDRGADVNSRNRHGQTNLMVAILGGHSEFVKLFLNSGADVNAKDLHGETALMNAVWRGDVELVQFLVENGADVNIEDSFGATSLSRASIRGHTRIVELLADAGARAPDHESTEDMKAKLFAPVTKMDVFRIPFLWDANAREDCLNLKIILSAPGNRTIDFEGIEIPVEVLLYTVITDKEEWTESKDRLVYKGQHVITNSNEIINIPYQNVDLQKDDEPEGAINVAITLPGGRIIRYEWPFGVALKRGVW